jgi:hypothetical protein
MGMDMGSIVGREMEWVVKIVTVALPKWVDESCF